MHKFFLPGLFLLITLAGCKSKQHVPEPLTEDNFPFEILDSVQASKAIITDDKDGFFENITPLDMSIQMKFSLNGTESRDVLLESYRSFLQTEVVDFSEDEKTFLKKVMLRAMNLCNSMSANLVPGPVRLIKTRGNHYGDGAFYTREKCIVIPDSDLDHLNEDKFLAILLHELSHIINRYTPELRDQLYHTIGFEKIISNEEQLMIPEPLKSHLLSNPDGLQMQYAIRLAKPDGTLFWALPLIHCPYDHYSADVNLFFGHLKFELFELDQKANGRFEVVTNQEGQSTLHIQEFQDFFEKIGDNTQYIIHPDEIIAENFYMMILATNKTAGFSMDHFSDRGKKLINEVKKTVMAH